MLSRRSVFKVLPILTLPLLIPKKAKAEKRGRLATFQLYMAPGEAVASYKADPPTSVLIDRVKTAFLLFLGSNPGKVIQSDISFTFMKGDWRPVSEPVNIRLKDVPKLLNGDWAMIDRVLNLSLWGIGPMIPMVEAERDAAKAEIDVVEVQFYVSR